MIFLKSISHCILCYLEIELDNLKEKHPSIDPWAFCIVPFWGGFPFPL